VIYADFRPLGEDTGHVEAHGLEVWLCGVEVVFGYGAHGILLAWGDGFQWVSEAGPAPQLDFHKDERLGSNIQTLATPELVFRVLLTEDGTQCLGQVVCPPHRGTWSHYRRSFATSQGREVPFAGPSCDPTRENNLLAIAA
jgi:hypothetical protein